MAVHVRSEVAVAGTDSYSEARQTVRLAHTGLASRVAADSWYCVDEQGVMAEHWRLEVAVGARVW